ncbi:hypothetical protein BDW75DRAFT_219500 [Aspergillus navahoensis]
MLRSLAMSVCSSLVLNTPQPCHKANTLCPYPWMNHFESLSHTGPLHLVPLMVVNLCQGESIRVMDSSEGALPNDQA